MKMIAAAAVLLSFSSAFAKPTPTMKCVSDKGAVLEYNQGFGELRVKNAAGRTVIDVDALAIGDTNYYERMPAIWETEIVYGDETPKTVFALIQKSAGKVSIVLRNTVYRCK